MTETHERPHLGAQTLADLQEQLLDPAAAAAATEHLAGCPSCAARRGALDDLRAQLQALPSPGAAPEDVVRRLDDALAAAAGTRSPTTASPTVTPLHPRRATPWNSRLLQAAAVLVVLAAAGGIGYGALRSGNTSDSGGVSAVSGADKGTDSARGGSEAAGGYPITASGRDYTKASLRAAVPALLAGTAGPARALASAPTDAASPDRLLNGTTLAACVANLAAGPVTPLAVDIARFEGQPATVIVLPTPGDPANVDVFAVTPECSVGTMLIFERAPRR